MKYMKIFAAIILSAVLVTAATAQHNVFTGKLAGVQETAAVISAGAGNAKVTISDDEQSIQYELTYSGLEGGSVLFAHIHVGQRNVAGGVAVFFCGGGNTNITKAACPQSGTLSGTWTAADLVGPKAQGVDPADPNAFARFIRAIRLGRSYANVHTTRSPSGEIRGQLRRTDGDDDHDGDADDHGHGHNH